MTREDRREQLLDAAARVVAQRGFAATTTADVAAAAGVSQPYVVRAFGGKTAMLEALFDRVGARVLDVFRAVPPGPGAEQALGKAYVGLVHDRDLLRVMLHGFSAAGESSIGARARAVLAQAARLFQEATGQDEAAARDFLAQGMLITVLMAVEAPEHADEQPALAALWTASTGEPTTALADCVPAAAAPDGGDRPLS